MRAFVDESVREAAGGGRGALVYVIAAAIVVSDEVGVRDALLDLRQGGSRVLHWHDERASRRLELTKAVAALGVRALATHCQPVMPKKQERARSKTLVALAASLELEGVKEMVIESRREPLDGRDRQSLLQARKAGVVRSVGYRHVGKEQDPLLWAADIVAGAVVAHLSAGESVYLEALGSTVAATVSVEP